MEPGPPRVSGECETARLTHCDAVSDGVKTLKDEHLDVVEAKPVVGVQT